MNTAFNGKDPHDFSKFVGTTLRDIRKERQWTMDELAESAGISKLTLGKIERGEANPSLAVIWKIANALAIPISALLMEKQYIQVLKKSKGNSVLSENQSMSLEPMFTTAVHGWIESHRATLKPHGVYLAEAHQSGVMEYVTVMKGQVTVQVKEEEFALGPYESIRFHADQAHGYTNLSSEESILHFVMIYQS
ncbi:helix-turn-helix domain-containing protein [Jeotgalibacillus sp. R-1-5s-1]|uniref:helix-turn-helix domain-containing protein n=1 Tax=Jeotgalibacillus sp. R-1-5s-1 TaxID=2555897 RepID=UPI001068DDC5|nr:XRE family transcriptional regulator [Jeotgalibacillus sp. R-1-5s-1]TFE00131.1 XRE family transcriptional regulator [Jeotgalibacillus sp. R-1-5s-1]